MGFSNYRLYLEQYCRAKVPILKVKPESPYQYFKTFQKNRTVHGIPNPSPLFARNYPQIIIIQVLIQIKIPQLDLITQNLFSA